jgi:hypothetical protein
MRSMLATEETVRSLLDQLRDAGCVVNEDMNAGTIEAREETGNVVYLAVKKGPSGPWITICKDGETFTWK